MSQRVLSFKKKTSLTVMNMDSKLINNHSVHPPLSARGGGGGALKGPQFTVGLLGKRGWLYSGGLQLSHKNKSKFEYLMA